MRRANLPELSLTEWAVLAITAEQPTHGFAIAKTLAPDGDVGRIWTVPRPLVYRALGALERHSLLEPVGAEAGDRGPNRTRIKATRAGAAAVKAWLPAPVPHVRDLRTQLLLKLKLLDRRDLDLRPLARAQLDHLGPILTALDAQTTTTTGFDHLVARWRYESARAAASTLEEVLANRPLNVRP